MAPHIEGPLYYERMGQSGLVIAFLHPNPMDQSCWIYQMAHLSTWYRCVAIDFPGYGRSPKATRGLTVQDLARACWEVIDEVAEEEEAILVGCSVGAVVARYMHLDRPDQAVALVLSGTGYAPEKEFAARRITAYRERGINYRWDYTFEGLSAAFRSTPLARYFADMFSERNRYADLQSIIYQFEALAAPDAPGHYARINCPTIILSGSEDNSHVTAFAEQEQIPGCELKTLHGAGHACHVEQPWLFNELMLEFLKQHGLCPRHPAPG